jgi:pimeloyl-ACP methyl ester carboxylesterase
MEVEAAFATVRDGIELKYKLHTSKKKGRKQILVCHHGYQSSSICWTSVLQHFFLNTQDYNVLTFDCRGAGESSHDSTAEQMTFSTLAADVIDLVDQIFGQNLTFTFIGLSMGTMVGLTICNATFANRIEKLILIAPGPLQTGVRAGNDYHEKERKHRALCCSNPTYFERAVDMYVAENPRFHDQVKLTTFTACREKHKMYLQICLSCSENHFDSLWTEMCNFRITKEQLKTIALKHGVLLVSGGCDDLLKDNMKDFVPMRFNCSLNVMPRVGHNICTQAPEELSLSILDFLQHGPITARTLNARRDGIGRL